MHRWGASAWMIRAAGAGILLAAGLIAAARVGDRNQEVAALGEPFPEYRTVSLTGELVSLGALRGRVVLLNVWSVWCAPCRAEIPVLEDLRRRYDPTDLEVVGVNVDGRGDEGTVDRFVRGSRITYTLWRDPNDSLPGRRLADGVPASYLIARDGTLVWAHRGALRRDDDKLSEALASALARPGRAEAASPSSRAVPLEAVRPALRNAG